MLWSLDSIKTPPIPLIPYWTILNLNSDYVAFLLYVFPTASNTQCSYVIYITCCYLMLYHFQLFLAWSFVKAQGRTHVKRREAIPLRRIFLLNIYINCKHKVIYWMKWHWLTTCASWCVGSKINFVRWGSNLKLSIFLQNITYNLTLVYVICYILQNMLNLRFEPQRTKLIFEPTHQESSSVISFNISLYAYYWYIYLVKFFDEAVSLDIPSLNVGLPLSFHKIPGKK